MPIWHTAAGARYRFPPPDQRASLTTMPGSTVPVIRQPFAPGDLLPFWAYGASVDDHHLYDAGDADEVENQTGSKDEDDAIELLRHALETIEAPEHQFARLGL